MELKKAYSRFLSANPDTLHFAAHSHHYWPDCTRDAQLQYWDDSARLVDSKWDHIFGKVIPEAQKNIAGILHTSHPENIAFAPNTHEFVLRLLSCFDPAKPLRVLTTDSEFHSFARQLTRYEESLDIQVTRIAVEPFATFPERFLSAAHDGEFDLIFVSQVFFNSGYVFKEFTELATAVKSPETLIAIDGYHAFCAVPTDLSKCEDRIFYLAGGYKYAQAGEGACFLHVPESASKLRPANTGWFSQHSGLSGARGTRTEYGENALRFWGSTFDPSGLYRFNAVMKWWKDTGLTVEKVHAHVQDLQRHFIEKISAANLKHLRKENLIADASLHRQGHFLTFRSAEAADVCARMKAQKVFTDSRADRLRFGFGLYQDRSDVDTVIKKLGASTA